MKLFFAFLLFPLVLIGQSKTVEQIHTLLDNNQLEQAKTLALKYHKENPNNLEAIEVLGDVYGLVLWCFSIGAKTSSVQLKCGFYIAWIWNKN